MKKNITSLFHAKNLALPLLLCLPMFGSNETKEIENMNEKVWNQFSKIAPFFKDISICLVAPKPSFVSEER